PHVLFISLLCKTVHEGFIIIKLILNGMIACPAITGEHALVDFINHVVNFVELARSVVFSTWMFHIHKYY
ncbi:MAG: hypothetical protein ACOCXD_03275, partial [Bacteroidota bacterium]